MSNVNAFGQPATNLSEDEARLFDAGDALFTQVWAPTSADGRGDGLGPLFNADSCSSCHLRDGRGDPEGDEPGLLIRLSVAAAQGTALEPSYGEQLQDRSVVGVPAEGTVRTIYVEESGNYADGTEYTLRRPVREFEDLAYGALSVDVQLSARLAPPVFGAGLLEAIPAESIVAAADPDDDDADGISGRPNYVVDNATGTLTLGRFGWKANVPTLSQQIAHAFVEDMGITSQMFPTESCTVAQAECASASVGGAPEIDQDRFDALVFYNATLAVPARRNLTDPQVEEGAKLFLDLNCNSCHTPRQETGEHAIDALSNQVIFPFTDLLLHDMGPGLADGRDDGQANGSEWRTPPLWGLGLNQIVNGHTFFLHDGRARSIEEAILWHGGEAGESADGFKQLDADQRAALIEFLESL